MQGIIVVAKTLCNKYIFIYFQFHSYKPCIFAFVFYNIDDKIKTKEYINKCFMVKSKLFSEQRSNAFELSVQWKEG